MVPVMRVRTEAGGVLPLSALRRKLADRTSANHAADAADPFGYLYPDAATAMAFPLAGEVNMAILIAIYSGQRSRPVAVCDAHCYDARTSESWCKCVCGEANHGVGVNQATANTLEHGQEWIDAYLANHQVSNPRVVYFPKPVQFSLLQECEESQS